MATINYTSAAFDSLESLVRYDAMTTTNADGAPIGVRWFRQVGIQVTGTFGSGGTVKLQGSLDGTNWVDLKDLGGSAIGVQSATTYAVVRDLPRFVRPLVSAGDGSTSLSVYLWFSQAVR